MVKKEWQKNKRKKKNENPLSQKKHTHTHNYGDVKWKKTWIKKIQNQTKPTAYKRANVCLKVLLLHFIYLQALKKQS